MPGKTKQIRRLKYKIFCPSGNKNCQNEDKANEKRAVLCFLHGSDEHSGNLTLNKALECHGPLKKDKATRKALGDRFTVIFPQLPAPGGNIWRRYAADVKEIVKSVWEECNGDPARTYLTGFSYGGNGVFHLASLQPDVWAAVWPVDPVLKPIPDLPIPVLVTLGQYSRNQTSHLQNHGYREMNEAGSRAKTVYNDYGENHVRTATSAYRDKRIYDWLLKKKLNKKRGK